MIRLPWSAAADEAVPPADATPAVTPTMPTWRNWITRRREGGWRFPDVEESIAPDNDSDIEGAAAIAEFLGIGEDVLVREAQKLRVPFVVREESEHVPGKFREEWLNHSMLVQRKAPPLTTVHALCMWMALNAPYQGHLIGVHVPGAKRRT